MTERPALSRTRVVDAAVAVADRGGLAAVSMRNVARELGVEAMSLYHHVANKDQLLAEMVDWIFQRIELPSLGEPWRPAMIKRAASAREVLGNHPWALGLIESGRSPAPALLNHHNTVLGSLRRGGFSVVLAAHAFSAIDSYVYGFVLTEQNLPFGEEESAEDFAAQMELPRDQYPHLAEMIGELVMGRDYAYANEFDYGLGLILDELERRLRAERR
jgi:AcrR family transcriptional regulator